MEDNYLIKSGGQSQTLALAQALAQTSPWEWFSIDTRSYVSFAV